MTSNSPHFRRGRYWYYFDFVTQSAFWQKDVTLRCSSFQVQVCVCMCVYVCVCVYGCVFVCVSVRACVWRVCVVCVHACVCCVCVCLCVCVCAWVCLVCV